jgi:hypothetical protein
MLAHKNNNVIGFEAKLGFNYFKRSAILEGHFNNAWNVFWMNACESFFSREGT